MSASPLDPELQAVELRAFELVVGVEVHAQLNTRTKLFCACRVEFAAAPNTRTCPVCLGLPGVLPVVNRAAFEKCARVAAAFGSRIEPRTELDRKNYYYPDLPKGYQISQMYHNLGQGGELVLVRSGKTIRMHNVHLEEDAGKLAHEGTGAAGGGSAAGGHQQDLAQRGPASPRERAQRATEGVRSSSVDLNRAGTPLVEIVTMPDFRSVDEVDDYMETLTLLLLCLDVSRCQMQEGNLRFEASVSVRRRGQAELGQRTEIKNLNSYSAVRKAVTYEHARQAALLLAGKTPRQETRLWDDTGAAAYEAGVPDALRVPEAAVRALLPKDWTGGLTAFMRSKEDAHDYRYFPEPDLPAFAVPPAWVEALRAGLPELPGPRRARYAAAGVPQRSAEDLTRDRPLAAYFERVVALGVPAPDAANYALNQVAAALNARGVTAEQCPIPPEHVAELHQVIAEGKLPKDLVLKQVWPRALDEGLSPRAVIAKHGIVGVDESAVLAETDRAFEANPASVKDLLAGKEKARGAIVGAVMRATKGKASPQVINARIDELLARARQQGQPGGA